MLLAPQIAQKALPGQFVMLLYGEEYSSVARRPFSIFGVDRSAGTISILYLARGSFTSELARKIPGESVLLLGPLGSGFVWTGVPGQVGILVAGGIGSPPLCFFASEFMRSRDQSSTDPGLIAIMGAKTANLLVGVSEMESMGVDVRIVTEDGSRGAIGLVTDALEFELNSIIKSGGSKISSVYACGPMQMLRTVCNLTEAARVNCQISIESRMPCGVGDCDGCQVHLHDPYRPGVTLTAKACWDGPVFNAREFVWPE